MDRVTAPSLSIQTKIDTGFYISFKRRWDKEPIKFSSSNSISLSSLSGESSSLYEKLKEIKKILYSNEDSWECLNEAISSLHREGRFLLYTLFDKGNDIVEATKICREAFLEPIRFRTWDEYLQKPHNEFLSEPPVIEYYSSIGQSIPIEILPLLDTQQPKDITNSTELEKAAKAFLGFSGIVRRVIREGNHSIPKIVRLENDPKLPIKFFINEDLEFAGNELEFLKGNEEQINVIGPWPSREFHSDMNNIKKKIAEYLWDSKKGFEGETRSPEDQIIHLSCHCYTDGYTNNDEDQNQKKFVLSLAFKGRFALRECEVNTRELKIELGDLDLESSKREDNLDHKLRPLIFINACGSSTINPASCGSFPELFLGRQYGYVGLIGTIIAIPDAFAADFSKNLYSQLLKGKSLSVAMHIARWHALVREKNLLGILYNLYAGSEIRLRKPVK